MLRVLPEVRGVGGSRLQEDLRSPALFSPLSAFSRLFQRLGKGWGSPFCGLWMSRNDGGGAIRLLYGPGQTLIYGQFSRYAPLAFIIWAYFHLKETICWAWNWKSVSKWAEAARGQK